MSAPTKAEDLKPDMLFQFGLLDNWMVVLDVQREFGPTSRIIIQAASDPKATTFRGYTILSVDREFQFLAKESPSQE